MSRRRALGLLAAGEQLRIRLVNHLDQPTNRHAHGLWISPEGHGDNPFVTVDPGAASTTVTCSITKSSA